MHLFSKAMWTSASALLFAGISACGRGDVEHKTAANLEALSDRQVASLATKKIFFGHQSVGNNIIEGIRDLENADPRLKVNIVKSPDPQAVSGPAFVEFELGNNGSPESKLAAFTAVLDKGMGAQGGIAILKFCYVDIDTSTDSQKLFALYRDEMSALRAKYPSLKIVHVTVPLTIADSWPKAWIKALLGKGSRQTLNAKRNQFNRLMRQSYAGREPLFDLEAIESTNADGSRSYLVQGDEKIYGLAPEFTVDGGHLNELGRRVAATRLLAVIAEL